MKRNATVKANDRDGNKIEVTVKFESDDALLSRDEVATIMREAARRIAVEVLPKLSYVDFGAENTRVKV